MKKKGFTLIEVIAVIALLSLLLLLVVPNITESYKKSQKKIFYDNVLGIYNTATQSFLLEDTTVNNFCHAGTKLKADLGEDIEYSVILDDFGQVTSLAVSNGRFYYSKSSSSGVSRSDISIDDIQESEISINCDGTISYQNNCIITDTNKSCQIYSFAFFRKNATI